MKFLFVNFLRAWRYYFVDLLASYCDPRSIWSEIVDAMAVVVVLTIAILIAVFSPLAALYKALRVIPMLARDRYMK